MTLQEYIDNLTAFAAKRPELLNKKVVYAYRSEGYDSRELNYGPTSGWFDGQDFTPEYDFEDIEDEFVPTINSVIINRL